MIDIQAHNNCCGVTVLSSFGGYEEETDDEDGYYIVSTGASSEDEKRIAKLFEGGKGVSYGRGMVYEAILIDAQMESWWDILKGYGFRKVCRFKNNNSGNYCTILHFYDGENTEEYQVFDPTHEPIGNTPMAVAG